MSEKQNDAQQEVTAAIEENKVEQPIEENNFYQLHVESGIESKKGSRVSLLPTDIAQMANPRIITPDDLELRPFFKNQDPR